MNAGGIGKILTGVQLQDHTTETLLLAHNDLIREQNRILDRQNALLAGLVDTLRILHVRVEFYGDKILERFSR